MFNITIERQWECGNFIENKCEEKFSFNEICDILKEIGFISLKVKNVYGQTLKISNQWLGSETGRVDIEILDSAAFYLVEEENSTIENFSQEIQRFLDLELEDFFSEE